MSIIEILLLGIALAMDCFSVSIATGLATRRIIFRPMATMALSFGFFQGGMTLMGYLGTTFFSSQIESIDHWIAFGLLLFLGIKMIRDSFFGDEEEENVSSNWLSLKNILTLSIATSIDAMAVGISFACIAADFEITLPVLIIGLCSTLFSIFGLGLGIHLGKRVNWHAEVLGGVVLIIIGIKILLEHLYG